MIPMFNSNLANGIHFLQNTWNSKFSQLLIPRILLASTERRINARKHVDKTTGYFKEHGYEAAATYMSRAKSGMFGYVHRWLRFGLISPGASAMVERVIREIGHRIKKIAYGRSDKGVTKIARIILKRFANIHDWEEYWQRKMNVLSNAIVTVRNYQYSSQNSGH